MKFLEFVPCGRKASPRAAEVEEAVVALPGNLLPSGPPTAAPASAPSHEKRRRRATGAGVAPQWRPTLGRISEDGVLRAEAASQDNGGRQRATPAGKTKAAAAAAAAARARSRDHRDDYRHITAPAVFPAFAPTAFLF